MSIDVPAPLKRLLRPLVRAPLAALAAQRESQAFARALAAHSGPLRIVIGAGGTTFPGWVPSEQGALDLLRPETWARHLADASVDALLSEHVWEHLTPEQGLVAARTCHRFLRPGGYLRVAVPDGNHPSPEYIRYVEVGGTAGGDDPHKVLYTLDTFRTVFEAVGFAVTPLEWFDAGGTFREADWSPEGGMIERSRRFEERNRDGVLRITSIILDAHKPE
jgi:predicted SAM-dependent methyltransferase